MIKGCHMMPKQKVWIPIILTLAIVFVCMITLIAFEWLLPSFPQILFGQVVMTQDSSPLNPRAYQSAEFILGQIELSEIRHSEYIHLQQDVLFWEPHYVGFPRTALTATEIRHFQQLLSGGKLFDQNPDGRGFQCVSGLSAQQPTLTPCTKGEQYQDQYLTYRQDAIRSQAVGVLQLHLEGGRLVEIRVYPSERGLAFEPYEKAGEWWFDGISAPSDQLDKIAFRTAIPAIEVLWPQKTTAQANARGHRIIGDQYQLARETIQNSVEVRDVFGTIQEIQPAAGINIYSSWMDSTSVSLTFRVMGTKGEGVVIIQGYDCFDLRMVIDGKPVERGVSYQCP
jgi:hypothetical protein